MDVGSTGVPHLDAASATSPHSADRHRPSLGVSDPEGSVFKLHSKGLSPMLILIGEMLNASNHAELVLRQRCSEQAAIITQHHLFPGPSRRVGPDEAQR
ncbi:unnamed protein product [Gadus morhua 'NCC']